MVKYFSDKDRRGIIKIMNKYDGYVWDYDSQMWIPSLYAADAQYDRRNFDEISPEETEKMIRIW